METRKNMENTKCEENLYLLYICGIMQKVVGVYDVRDR